MGRPDPLYLPLYTAPPAVLAAHGVVLHGPRLWPALHQSPATPFWEMNAAKGRLGEDLLARAVSREFLGRTGHWVPCTPARIGNQGIDAIYFKVDGAGNVRDVVVAEAKWGTSQLRPTHDGMQMSAAWIAKRLRQTAAVYASAGEGEWAKSWSPAPGGAPRLTVPLPGGRSVDVWLDRAGKLHLSDSVDPRVVQRQLCRVAQTLRGTAEGRISFRAKLFRVDHDGVRFRLRMYDADPVSGALRLDASVDAELSKRLSVDAFRKMFRDWGYSAEQSKVLAAKSAEDPAFFDRMSREARWSVTHGLDRTMLVRAAAAALFGFAVEGMRQLWHRELSFRRLVLVTGASAVGGAVGHYVGVQVTSLLRTTTFGQRLLGATPLRALGAGRASAMLGGAAGGAGAGLVVAYGLWLAGLLDLRTANRQVVAAVVGAAGAAGATTAAVAAASAWGVAGTGTAIVELSGAAATNATLAWFGGGSLAAGGFGMGVGATVLTAGAAAVAMGLMAATSWIFHLLDEGERRSLTEGRMKLVNRRVRDGAQPEWKVSTAG